jgi:hypothetical protein
MKAHLLYPIILLCPASMGQSFVDGAAQIPAGSPGNNSPTEDVDFADVDGDGDFDVVFADGGNQGNDRNRIWINQGGLQGGVLGFFTDDTAARFPAVQDTSRDVDFVDYDGDGDQDLLVSNTSSESIQSNRLLTNMGGAQGGAAGYFVDETSSRWVNIGVNNGSTSLSSVPAALTLSAGPFAGGFVDWSCDSVLGDLDGDGDPDVVHSSYGPVFSGTAPARLFLNDGAGYFEEYNPSGFQLSAVGIADGDPGLWAEGLQLDETQATNGSTCDINATPLGIELGDLDGDWDIDILLGERNFQPRVFQNRLEENGGILAPFRDVTHASFAQLAVGGGNYEQELGDFDNDDDLDLYGLNWGGVASTDVVARNTGGSFGPFTNLAGSSPDDNALDFFDYDADGDLDVYVFNFSGQDRLYQNGGAPAYAFANVTQGALPPVTGISLGGDTCDVDLDGDYDVMVAYDAFAPNKLLVNVTEVPDAIAPRVRTEQVPDGPGARAVRARVFDNSSWDVLRYDVTELLYRVDGGPLQNIPMVYVGGQMFRGVIPAPAGCGVEYAVRATDEHGNTGVSVTLHYSAAGTVSYCTAGTSASGCQALLSTTGTPSASASSGFTVDASGMEGAKAALVYFGTNGRKAVPWGNGTSWQCVVLPTKRGGPIASTGTPGACDGAISYDLNARWASKPIQNPGPGTQVQAQLWYRDPLNTSNQTTSLSDAIEFTVCP